MQSPRKDLEFFPVLATPDASVEERAEALRKYAVIHREVGGRWHWNETNEVHKEGEFWMVVNRKPLKIEPTEWDSRLPNKYRKDPLELREIEFDSDGLVPVACLEYPFVDANVTWDGSSKMWVLELHDSKGEHLIDWSCNSIRDFERTLPIAFFYNPDVHDEGWLNKYHERSNLHVDGTELNWMDERMYRGAGWYYALKSRQHNYDRDVLPEPRFWNLHFLAWYFRYKVDFMEIEDEPFEWESILVWEEILNELSG